MLTKKVNGHVSHVDSGLIYKDKFVITCILAFLFVTLSGCSTMGKMTNVELQPAQNECVYISNLDEMIRNYTVNDKSVYGGSIGYQGISLGGDVAKDGVYHKTGDRLGQHASTIRYVLTTIAIMNNHSCSKNNIQASWKAINLAIRQLGDTYAPAIARMKLVGKQGATNEALIKELELDAEQRKIDAAVAKTRARTGALKSVIGAAIGAKLGLKEEEVPVEEEHFEEGAEVLEGE